MQGSYALLLLYIIIFCHLFSYVYISGFFELNYSAFSQPSFFLNFMPDTVIFHSHHFSLSFKNRREKLFHQAGTLVQLSVRMIVFFENKYAY